ncbi:hypothetical protein DO62_5811 [Burkholderia pseudomallei]|nr:hypothetical protein DO62_5811 [Burkholderia pseudomallei]
MPCNASEMRHEQNLRRNTPRPDSRIGNSYLKSICY